MLGTQNLGCSPTDWDDSRTKADELGFKYRHFHTGVWSIKYNIATYLTRISSPCFQASLIPCCHREVTGHATKSSVVSSPQWNAKSSPVIASGATMATLGEGQGQPFFHGRVWDTRKRDTVPHWLHHHFRHIDRRRGIHQCIVDSKDTVTKTPKPNTARNRRVARAKDFEPLYNQAQKITVPPDCRIRRAKEVNIIRDWRFSPQEHDVRDIGVPCPGSDTVIKTKQWSPLKH